MKKYLVTGGSGFIGSNVIRELVKQQKEIHIFVEKNSDLWRIKDLLNFVKIYQVDLVDFEKIGSLIFSIKPNIVFHLAAYGVHPDCKDQKKMFDVNFYGTINLLNACSKVGFDCFVNTGTSSEYGNKNKPMHEDDQLCPLVDYAVSKTAATQYCCQQAITKKLSIYTVRPFGVYGDYETEHRLIPTIVSGFLQQKKINLSNPEFVRDFIYVKDVVRFYFNLVDKKPKNYFVFNIGTGVQSSILDVVSTFEFITGKKLNVHWGKVQARPWEVKNWVASTKRSKEILGFIAEYNLEEGLKNTLEWFEENSYEKKFSNGRSRFFGKQSL